VVKSKIELLEHRAQKLVNLAAHQLHHSG